MNTRQCGDGVQTSILQTSLYNFDQAARRLALDDAVRQKVLGPKERIELNINPILSDEKVINVKVFLVRHNDVLGPAKGGIRMTPDVTLDDVTGLAMEMTWKTSVIGVPFGGGKSGIRFDPTSVSANTKEVIIRSFTRGARRHIGPEIYVPAPDMGTNEMDMAHIRDCIAYSQGTSITNGCFVTGKPLILGGIAGRREATGKGVVYTILALCEKNGWDLAQMRVAVQGFGNVGSVAAVEAAKHGARVVGVADITGGIVNPDGLDVDALLAHVKATGGVRGFPGGTDVDGRAILEMDCDILIPAASGSQITGENVDRVQARVIAEGANAPTTPEADEVFNRRGTLVIPDILCNAGGVFVSYLEYTQETQREQMTLAEVEQRLAERMSLRFQEIHAMSEQGGMTMRDAAMNMAVSRVVEGIFARGLLP
ncbi:MAG: Glu/Leu/Phe/Val dehydrogenase [Planctomycetia bacterium]|nr:Glu/Leu/Phe/Val dehydrogenase [Planctomycetia bacterium]